MRLFVAIRLSDELKKELIGTMHVLKKLGVKGSYVPADNLHVTLAFIGETSEPERVKEALSTVKWKAFRLSLPTSSEKYSSPSSRSSALWLAASSRQPSGPP